MAHKTDVFLSHNWGKDKLGRENHDRVSLINEGLKTYGFETWFDTERVKDEILSEVADGIDNTQGVIAFITQDYHDKVNGEKTNDFCKLEFDYAVKKKSPAKMLAVGMEKDMCDSDKWTKTVGIIFAKKLFIDMSGDLHDQNYFRQKIELLKNRLEACGIKPSNSVNRNEGSMQLPKDNGRREQLDQKDLRRCFGKFFFESVIPQAMLKVLSQQLQDILTTEFERQPPAEDFTEMNRQRSRA